MEQRVQVTVWVKLSGARHPDQGDFALAWRHPAVALPVAETAAAAAPDWVPAVAHEVVGGQAAEAAGGVCDGRHALCGLRLEAWWSEESLKVGLCSWRRGSSESRCGFEIRF